MSELVIPQAEADKLIQMEKVKADDEDYDYPGLGGKLIIPLTSRDGRESFLLDIERGRINLLKGKYQNRVNQAIVLLRLDFGGSPHRNPDDTEVPCPHLHIYREGEGDKWAIPIYEDTFPNLANAWDLLGDFMSYCHITEPPKINSGLFR